MTRETGKKLWWPGPIILIFVIILIWFPGWIPGCEETPEEKAAREQREAETAARTIAIEAYVMAETFVKRQLRAPATAKFAPFREAIVSDLGDGRFFIAAYVDAENAFGALIRTPFQATLRREGDMWYAESVEMITE
ncbi:MAG TPA: hypothetical protein VLH56_17995 [Dissulfurispiraceae bacterium]|nr:hypothetical protein [Dissulfurispiraceae bacterium]